MGLIDTVKRWAGTLSARIREIFGVEALEYDEQEALLDLCEQTYRGRPYWLDADDQIRTINFAESVCSEIARLTTMNIEVTARGSARADWLQQELDREILPSLRRLTEYGCAFGTMILKPNGEHIDVLFRDRFRIVQTTAGQITGVVFLDRRKQDDRWFTRYEYHDLSSGEYWIHNRYYVGSSATDIGRPVAVEVTPWVDSAIADDVRLLGVDKPLFGIFRTPRANNIDFGSPLGLPIFSSALEELKDLDIAYSRATEEIKESARIVLLDSDRLFPFGGQTGQLDKSRLVESAGLPRFVKAVEGSGSVDHEVYHEINPSLNTKTRLEGIDALLSQIGFKCGFSNGYFVFNEKTGMVTATQVEADDRRTIQLISDVRASLRACLDGLIYALNAFADAYGLAPRGAYEVAYDFADLTLNEEEDKARWYSYVLAGKVPFWWFLMTFEGMTEEDAKALEAAAQSPEPAMILEE